MKAARARGVKSGPKPKLTRQQIEHARKLIGEGQRHEATAALFNVSRVTLYRALLKASLTLEGGERVGTERKGRADPVLRIPRDGDYHPELQR